MEQLQTQIAASREECFGEGEGSFELPDTAQVIYSYFTLRGPGERTELTEADVARLARQLHVTQPKVDLIRRVHSLVYFEDLASRCSLELAKRKVMPKLPVVQPGSQRRGRRLRDAASAEKRQHTRPPSPRSSTSLEAERSAAMHLAAEEQQRRRSPEARARRDREDALRLVRNPGHPHTPTDSHRSL